MAVNTVRGTIDPADLGSTLIHEHVSTADWSMRAAFGDDFHRHDVVAKRAVAQFSRARDLGLRTVVDGTPVNMGRDIRLITQVAERADLNFVVSSGFYFHEESYLQWRSEDEIYTFLSRECADGAAGTDVRPGIMKAACADAGITPVLEKVFRAIGRVAAEHELPVFVHHHPHVGNGLQVVDLLESCGVAPGRLIIGHAGDSTDLDYLSSLARRGCRLGMDRFGWCEVPGSGPDLSQRVATIAALHRQGHAENLLLSHDQATYWGVFGSWEEYEAGDPTDVDFTFVQAKVLPALIDAGLTPAEAEDLLIGNPRRLFGTS